MVGNSTLFRNFFTVIFIVFGGLAVTVKPDEEQDASKISMCELSLAQLLLLPPDSIQVQALKRELLRYLAERLEEDDYTKYTIASMLQEQNIPFIPKENFGEVYETYPAIDNDDLKRSIANLAKNGQLPTFQKSDEDHTKRGIESLARNGDLHGKRKLDDLYDSYGKRNIGSLARGFNFPAGGKRYIGALARSGDLRYPDDMYDKRNIASIVRNNGKRSVASLVRTNNLPSGKRYLFDEFKRNIASIARSMGAKYTSKRAVPTSALLRQDNYMNGPHNEEDHHHQHHESDSNNENNTEEKRNIASLKAQIQPKFKRSTTGNGNGNGNARTKRQADYWEPNEEYPVPVYQNSNGYDYEELMQALADEYPAQDKRFLGRIPQMGRPKSTPSSRRTR